MSIFYFFIEAAFRKYTFPVSKIHKLQGFENLPGMFGLPEGRGRATLIFGKKSNVGIIFKFLSHRVAYNPIIFKFRALLVTLSGVAGPYYGPATPLIF